MILVDEKNTQYLQLELEQEFSNQALLVELVVFPILTPDPRPESVKVGLQAVERGLYLACKTSKI